MPDESNSDTLIQRRSIRSFVLRQGRATVAQQRALEELWPKYGIAPPAGSLSFEEIFGRRAPRMLEIGFGAGEALLHRVV